MCFRFRNPFQTDDLLIELIKAGFDLTKYYDDRDHTTRVAKITKILLKKAAKKKTFEELSSSEIPKIVMAAGLHDIGKCLVGYSDEEEMKEAHTRLGANTLAEVFWNLEVDLGVQRYICMAVEAHHEHFDGNGYPAGLSGKEIPFHAAVIGIANFYDCQKDKLKSHSEVMDLIKEESGKRFAPVVVELFNTCEKDISRVVSS
ncbi:MAG: HD domain-containing protein [Lachnospiraceae bacterium]|jgi:HD-GYP domain-containing protein (c-di-GMP phosphodiesterase class II)|nr:HD domain-containing protein [Lachnospiraceae bacterium]